MPRRVAALVLTTAAAIACLLPAAPAPLRWLGPEYTNADGIRLARIPAGAFWMGPPNDGDEASPRMPRHRVCISRPFYIGVHEVTQGQYERVMGKNPSWFSKGTGGRERVKGVDASRLPVESVSWHDAMEFCARLSARPADRNAGRVYRLPTEAEWEYACRAGEKEYRRYSFGHSLTGKANHSCDGASLSRSAVVGSYAANAWGLHDMHGNVWEWCEDWYAAGPRRAVGGPARGEMKVMRGGSWQNHARLCRSAARESMTPTYRGPACGFRVVLEVG